jgi:allophanate hydrolase subunit 2
MGGYPIVAHVISADLDRIGQARPGDPLRFSRVTLAEARRLDREERAGRAARLARVATAAADRPRPGD